MFREQTIFENIDLLLNSQEFWRRSLNSCMEYGEQVSRSQKKRLDEFNTKALRRIAGVSW